MNGIFIYSVCNQTFTKSKIRCPKSGHHRAFAVNDTRKMRLSLLVSYGLYGRTVVISALLFPTECIHLFKVFGGEFYKIGVFKLF